MWRNILTGVAAVALCAGVSAQQTAQVHSKDGVNVQYLGTYSFKDHNWSTAGRAGTRVLYNCTTPGNYYSNIGNSWSTGADHLWIDEGKVGDTNTGRIDQVNGFDFAYCSTDPDPTGNSGSIGITYYDDYVPCTAPPAATCAYILTGLPLGGAAGNLQCWGVGVDLEGGFECTTDPASMFSTTDAGVSDRYFGWAFGSNPGMTGMNNTGPILDLPCATPIASNGCGSGNENFFYWYDPAGVWSGCYWFGGIPWASFSMKMYGPSTNAFRYGYANNTMGLSASNYAPGTVCTFTVTGNTSPALYLLAAPATGSIFLGGKGTLVISTSFLPPTPVAMNAGTGILSTTIPAGVPANVYVQCAGTSGPATPGALVALTNGLFLKK